MKGWQFTTTNEPLILAEIAEPEPGPGEVVLDVKAAGLCHSDVGAMTDKSWLALIPNRPIVIGHEIAGVIAKVGPGVSDWKVGDRVGVCPTGDSGVAPGYGRDGGFTYQHRVAVGDLVKMPDGLSFEMAALGTDAGMTSYHGIMVQGELKAGMKVGIIGMGGLGQIAVQVALVTGAEVHVAEPQEKARELAAALGVTNVVADASEWANQDFDLVVDYAGFSVTTKAAVAAIRRDGRVVLVGMGKPEYTVSTFDTILKQAQIYGSNGGTKSDVAAIYDLLASKQVTPQVTIIGFDDIPSGIDDLKNHRIVGRLVAHIAD